MFAAKWAVRGRACPWLWLEAAWVNSSIFVWLVSDLGFAKLRESLQRLTIVLAVSGRVTTVPILFVRTASVSRRFWVALPAKNQDAILPAASGRVPSFFRTPLKPQVQGRGQVREELQLFSGTVSSGQLKYAAHPHPILREGT